MRKKEKKSTLQRESKCKRLETEQNMVNRTQRISTFEAESGEGGGPYH